MSRGLLGLYGAATTLLTPAATLLLRRRLKRGKEDPNRIAERRGRASRPRPPGTLVWLHGASLGEGLALLPVVDALVDRGATVLITTGTVNSARVLADRLPPGVIHQFVPLDLPGFMRRFLDHWRPALVLLAESELWPNLLAEVARRRTPLALVNARMSARSFGRWRRAPWVIAALLDQVALCLAQTEEDGARFAELGAVTVKVTGNIKFDAPPPPADPRDVDEIIDCIGGRPFWLAASTHADEEALLLAAHRRIAATAAGLLTIVAPRQPDRGPALAAAAACAGLRVALRSRSEAVGPGTDLYVADTVGELGLFYRASEIVYVGRSLAGGGGQSPIEPAKLGCAVLHGPQVENLAEPYRVLDEAGGALCVRHGDALADAVLTLLADPGRRAAMAARATEAVGKLTGATERTVAALAPLLPVRAGLAP